jgi:hypothetical protein
MLHVRQFGFFRFWSPCMTRGTQPPCHRGRTLEHVSEGFGAAAARWCGVGGQVAAVVGAEVVAAREGFSTDETVGATCGRTSGSSALTACPRPSCGDVGEGLPTTAFALRLSESRLEGGG